MVVASSVIREMSPLQNQHLTTTYSDHWIGRGWPMSWPPRSPDLTPMDFLWNHTETLINASPVDSEEDHIACIVEAAGTIRQQPDIF